jgi:hypothetical protein
MGGCIGTISLVGGVQTFSINGGAETEAMSINPETATNGFIQIGIDTDPNGTGAAMASCSSAADRH